MKRAETYQDEDDPAAGRRIGARATMVTEQTLEAMGQALANGTAEAKLLPAYAMAAARLAGLLGQDHGVGGESLAQLMNGLGAGGVATVELGARVTLSHGASVATDGK